MSELVLSLFPGGGFLDYCFEQQGFTVVRGPEWLFGQDVRDFHPPAGVFDGIIGGDPCQAHSTLSNLVRAKGLEPSFPDMTPDYERVVEEARPAWFLRENVPGAPSIKPDGYSVRTFMLDNSTLGPTNGEGKEQMRTRRFWFGVCPEMGTCPELRRWIEFAWFLLPDTVGPPCGHGAAPSQRERTQAVAADARAVAVAIGGSGKVNRTRQTAVGGNDGTADAIQGYRKARQQSVTGRNEGAVGAPGKDYSPPRRSLEDMLELQGYPRDWMERQPWTVQAKRKMVGNAVPRVMGEALAKAVKSWLAEREAAA